MIRTLCATTAALAVAGTAWCAGLEIGAPLPPATGLAHPDLAPFDALLTSFVREKRVPGAALAVVKDGRLVLARGYGWADVEAKEPVRPTSLFRIASLSKPITAAAVLQLVERGKLALDAAPFRLLGVKPHLEPGAHVDPRLARVTVLELLRHTGGFDRGVSFDPMFRSIEIARALGVKPPARPVDVIRYMWGRPLDFDPGARYAYSNFGYCVLGRVIESVTGTSYEKYVREQVLAPLGVQDMRIGKTLRDGRAPGEVIYYDRRRGKAPAVVGKIGELVENPYGAWYLEAMDAHGGWTASVVDMARFAATFDDPESCPILLASSIRKMFARPPGRAGHRPDGKPLASYYGCGWKVRPTADGRANQWHTGSLPGTGTLMVRRHDGLCWVVFFNARSGPDGVSLTKAIDPLLHGAAGAVRSWPARDLFARYGISRPWKRHVIDGSSRGADGVRLMDVNGDGLQDMTTGWEEGGVVRVYLNPGTGKVKAPWPAVTAGRVRSPEDAVFADLDGDGNVDVVSSCEGNTRSVFVHWAPRDRERYLDARAWKTGVIPATKDVTRWMFALPMQLDGKGGVDLVVGSKNPAGMVGWLRSPAEPRDLAAWKLQPLCRAGWIMSLVAQDLDGDGDRDVLVSDRKGLRRGVFWLENPGPQAVLAGAPWKEHRVGAGDREVMFLAVGDLDGDGHRDIVAAVRGRGFLLLRAAAGRGTSGDRWEPHEIPMPAGCGTGKGAAILDVDRDGRNDLVFTCENAGGGKSAVRWLSWEDSPVDGPWRDHEISGPRGTKFDRIEVLDLDGDGDLDVITCEERENLGVIWYENPAS